MKVTLSLARRTTYADYLAAEQGSERPDEFIDGVIVASLARTTSRQYPEDMAVSERVQRILSDVRGLTDEEKLQLEAELLAEDTLAEPAWGTETDRRAARVLAGEASGLGRDEVRALFAMSPIDARARLATLLDARK